MMNNSLGAICDNKCLTEILTGAISDRFLLSDFPKYDDGNILSIKANRSYILLGCRNEAEKSFLEQNNYHTLIADILMYSEIPDKLRDMAQCIYSAKDIDDIVSAFAHAQESLRYIWKDEGVVFMAPEFFVDIMVRPLSQFHIQLTEAYKTFSEALRHIPVENLYLEATSPSYLSQYAQYWVAEKLGMIHFNSNIVVV